MELLEGIYDLLNNNINEIKIKTNMIYKKMRNVTELDMITLYLMNGKLNKIMTQSNKDLKNSLLNILNDYTRFWRGQLQQKYQCDNANKMIVDSDLFIDFIIQGMFFLVL